MKTEVHGGGFVDHTIRPEQAEQIVEGRSAIDGLINNLNKTINMQEGTDGYGIVDYWRAKQLIMDFVDSYNAGRALGAGAL